jgi:acetylornithine/succinyldiaminopimelate/putrescine aminotransferase
MGRVGHPFAANLYGVTPDMITTAKALGNGFPCAALLMMKKAADAVKLDSLGTTFGGGPMASAAIEATIDAIESEGLLENVRRVAQYIRKTCIVGPVPPTRASSPGLHRVPAKAVQMPVEADILTGTW